MYSRKCTNILVELILLACTASLAFAASAQVVSVQEDGPASITFVKTTHDFGAILDSDPQATTFPFTNSGVGTLRILDVKASCGCTTPALSKMIFAPGESSEIEVQYKAKSGGSQSKTITVFTNDPNQPAIELTIKADVTQFLTTEPRLVRFARIAKGTSETVELKVDTIDPEAIIDRIQVTGKGAPWFKATLVPDSEGETEQSRVIMVELLPTTPWGQHFATLTIRSTGRIESGAEPIEHSTRVTLSAKVVGVLHASSTMFRVGVVPVRERFTSVVKLIRPDGKPFEVLSATVSDSTLEGMAVSVAPVPKNKGGGYTIVLTGTPMETEQRIAGEVNIFTDVPGEETLAIRIGGVARSRP